VQAVTAERCRRCAAAALDIAGSTTTGRADELTVLRHVQLLADEMRAHARWLRHVLVAELVGQGLTQERIAMVLGVTRQRVTTLVRETASGGQRPPPTRLPRFAGHDVDAPLPAVSWTEDLLLDAVFEQCAHGLALADPTGRLLRVNSSFARLLRREPLELVGDDYRSYESAPEDGGTPPHESASPVAPASGQARAAVWQRTDGSRIGLRLLVTPVRPPRERRLVGYAVEVWPDSS
jgi:PAS domain-containing protein